jgi:predicted Fe-Mo cluster-binding NifX family protein
MKLCIPAEAGGLDARVDLRLGRAPVFVFADSETGKVLGSAPNSQDRQAASGAGIQAAQTIAETGAEAVLCANIGPKAFRVLNAASIRVYVGVSGTVADAVRAFAAGTLHPADAANVEGHW